MSDVRGGGVRRRRRGRAAACAAVALALGAAGPARAAPDPSPPGANDWSCHPTPAHRRPVVLVHGLGATMGANWGYLSPRLKSAGYCVFALTYGQDPRTDALPYSPGGVVAMEQSARQFAAFVHRVLAATGAHKVDLVGHSEGTVMPRYYLKFLGGASRVEKFVALTPLWRGTNLAELAVLNQSAQGFGLSQPLVDLVSGFCASCPEFLHNSPFMNALNHGGEAVHGVTYTSLVTRYDELVSPYTSGIMHAHGATNIVVQDVCPNDTSEHVAMASDPVVAQLVLNALHPVHHPAPIAC